MALGKLVTPVCLCHQALGIRQWAALFLG